MKKSTKIASALITGIVLALFVWYFKANHESFDALLRVSPALLIATLIVKLVRIHNSGLFIQHTLSAYQKDIPARESFYISLLSSMGNFFGPFLGGASIRAIYLKKKYNFTYTDFMSTLSGYYFISFLVSSLFGLVALVTIQLTTGYSSWLAYAVFAGWFVSTLIFAEVQSIHGLIGWFKNRIKILDKLLNKINQVIIGWRIVRDDKQLFLRLNRLSVYGFLISAATAYLEFRAIGVNLQLAPLALYTALSALSLLVSVTPGSVGVREALLIFSNDLMGTTTEQILQVAVIDRGLTFILVAVVYVVSRVVKLPTTNSEHKR